MMQTIPGEVWLLWVVTMCKDFTVTGFHLGTMCSVYTPLFKSYDGPDRSTTSNSRAQPGTMRFREGESLTQGLAEQSSNLECHLMGMNF